MDESTDIVGRALAKVGGPVEMAKALKARNAPITSQAVSQWRRIPAERVLAVEAITGISRHELRTDLYGPEPSRAGAG